MESIVYCLMFLLLVWISYLDLKFRKISNIYIIILLLCVLLLTINGFNIKFERSDGVYFFSAGVAFLLTLPLFIKHMLGAADVKILMVISLMAPLEAMVDILLFSLISFALYWSLFARGQKEAPFVPSILVGMVVTLWVV